MSDIFVVFGGAALLGFLAGVLIGRAFKLWKRLRARSRRFRFLG